MTGMIPIGNLQVATDVTMGYEIRRSGSHAQSAVDSRVEGVAAQLIADDPTITAAALAAVDAQLASGASKQQTVENVSAAVPGVWRMNLAPIPVPFPAPSPSTGWGHGGPTAGTNSRVGSGGPNSDTAPAFYRRTFSATASGVNSIFYGGSAAEAGYVHTVSMSGRASWTGRHCLQVSWRNSAGSEVGIETSPWSVPMAPNLWHEQIFVTGPAPATAVTVQVRYVVEVGGSSSTPTSGHTIDGSAVCVEQGTSSGGFFNGRSLLSYFTGVHDQSTSRKFQPVTDGAATGVLTVSPISGAADFTTIQAAVDAQVPGGTILIYPGEYVEQVSVAPKPDIHLIGLNRDTCIIRDSSGAYSTPPLEIGSGSVRNLTIIEDHAAAGTNHAAFEDQRAYTIHADNYDSMVGRTLVIESCTLKNTRRAALGMGTYQGTRIIVRDCDIWAGAPVLAGDRKRGAVYFHNAHATGPRTDQHVEFHNTRIFCADDIAVFVGDSSPASGFDSELEVLFTQCVVWSEVGGKANSVVAGGGAWTTQITKHPASFGNNVSLLNA